MIISIQLLGFLNFRLDRLCIKDINYDEYRIKIKKGVMITVPTYALHRNEEYFAEPNRFDPDR